MTQACLGLDIADVAPKQKRYVLHGLGGSGKTQLCLKFAEDYRDKYWGVFWVDMSTDTSAHRSFSDIGRICGVGKDVNLVWRWLSHCDRSWVLIMDNADNPQQKISQFFPVCNHGTIIITTRNPRLSSHATVGWQVVDRMEADEAISLLLRIVHEDTASLSLHEIARPVVEILGCLALAVVQAGAAISHGLCTLVEFPSVFAVHRHELLNRYAGQISEDYKKTVYTTWEISLSMIQAIPEPVASDALELLQVFSFMHYDGVPEELFNLVWEGLQRNDCSYWIRQHQLQLVTRQKGPQWDSYPLREVLSTLASFSLITYDKDKLISLHPLVHSWVRFRLDQEQQELLWRVVITTLSGAIRWQYTMDDYRIRRLLHPHLNACVALRDEKIFDLLTESLDCLDMIEKIAFTYGENGQFSQALKLAKKVTEVYKRMMGEEHPDTVRSIHSLALRYSEAGRRAEALELMAKVVEVMKRTIGEEHPDTIGSMHDLAYTYRLLDRREEALVLMKQVMTMSKRVMGEVDIITLESLRELAVLYNQLNESEKALKLAESVCIAFRKEFGEEYPNTLMSMNDLAKICNDCGQRTRALEIATEVEAKRNKVLGRGHPNTLTTMHDLAQIKFDMGQRDEATRLMKEVAEDRRRILGGGHPDTVESQAWLEKFTMVDDRLGQSTYHRAHIDQRNM